MRASGSLVERGVKEHSLIPRVKYFKVSGEMTKLMDSESTFIQTGHSMKENGAKICNMEWEKRGGRMDQFSKVVTEKARKMVLENTFGLMALAMRVNGKIMKLQATGSTSGPMVENISGIGEATLWTSSEYILGKMEECMKDSTKKIKSMDLEYILGQIKNDTQAGGLMESSMASEFSFLVREKEN